MNKIIKIGEFEFIILVIVQYQGFTPHLTYPRLKDINEDLNKRYKKKFSKGYISKVMKKLREAGLVKVKNNIYSLTKNGEYYLELYDKLNSHA